MNLSEIVSSGQTRVYHRQEACCRVDDYWPTESSSKQLVGYPIGRARLREAETDGSILWHSF